MSTAAPDADTVHEAEVNRLLRLPERRFEDAAIAHVMDRERTAADEDVWRDPDVVERTYEAVKRAVASVEAAIAERPEAATPGLWRKRRRLQQEARVLRPLANEAREAALRADRSLSPRKRAEQRLLRELLEGNRDLQRRLVGYVRDERAKDARDAQ